MPGYIFHLAEAQVIIDEFKKRGRKLSSEWENLFMLGNLLPDTNKNKTFSHFRNPEEAPNIAVGPNLKPFLEAYGKYLEKPFAYPLVFGYYVHLRMDFNNISRTWPKLVEFRGRNGQVEKLLATVERAWIKNYEKEVGVKEFLSDAYYYGDFTKMTGWTIEHYQIHLPEYREIKDSPICETDTKDLKTVLEELEVFRENATASGIQDLKVFRLEDLQELIEDSAKEIFFLMETHI